jgi:hypothetical protein
MSSWKKVSNLFWQSGDSSSEEVPTAPAEELSDVEFQALLAQSPHAVPQGPADPVRAEDVRIDFAAGVATIDFQAQYDAAGIPDTDEVEQLENFLSRLDASLPNASKQAAAQAFLGAIGKSKDHVLEDAGRKIQRVRGVLSGKEQEIQASMAHEQALIDDLQRQIEQHRQQMQALTHELEGVRQACLVEESRLQAARVFFGSVEPVRR